MNIQKHILCLPLFTIGCWSTWSLSGAERAVDARMHHVRLGAEREWSEFPAAAEADELVVDFEAPAATQETTLRLRHRDVKQRWTVELNGRTLGTLPVDENTMVTFWPIPADTLKDEGNRLRVYGAGKASDDVMLGDVRYEARSRATILSAARLEVFVNEQVANQPTPARITILDADGSLMTTGAASDDHIAVRPGIVYTATGRASVPMPSGKFTIVAGRGFEYSIARTEVELLPNETQTVRLTIDREVPTAGYAACDTHCHTFTYSRHGDATLDERLIALAGEGIELPVAADHNLIADYRPRAAELNVARFFTAMSGEEVTTGRGHFNVFPLDPASSPIDHRGADWPEIFAAVAAARPRLVVLNHAQDVHSGFRPFDPEHHIGIAGERLDGRRLQANAMEVINSGTTQSDGLQLFGDWFGLLNRGLKLTPVGASDSHDVGRHFVGQGRTYVRCGDEDPGAIDLDEVCRSLEQGRVLVSYGLLTDMQVDDRYGPGDLVPAGDRLRVGLRVLGPAWTRGRRVMLYSNGVPIREADIEDGSKALSPGVQWSETWTIDRPKHDVFLAVIATGPGVRELYWPTPKPYQPRSADWAPYVLGATGAVWIDADGDGRHTSAFEYARRLFERTGDDVGALVKLLADYDEAVAIQAASLWKEEHSLFDASLAAALRDAAPQVRHGFQAYTEAWRVSQERRVDR